MADKENDIQIGRRQPSTPTRKPLGKLQECARSAATILDSKPFKALLAPEPREALLNRTNMDVLADLPVKVLELTEDKNAEERGSLLEKVKAAEQKQESLEILLKDTVEKSEAKDEAVKELNDICQKLEDLCRVIVRKVQKLEQTKDSANQRVKALEEQVDRADAESDEQRQDMQLLLSDARHQLQQRGLVIATLRQKLETGAEVLSLRDQLEVALSDNAELKTKAAILEEKLELAEIALRKGCRDQEDMRGLLATLQSNMDASKASREALTAALELIRQTAERDLVSVKKELAAALQELAEKARYESEGRAEIQDLKLHLEAVGRDYAAVMQDKAGLKRLVSTLQEQTLEQEQTCKELQDALAMLQRDLAAAVEDRTGLKKLITFLQNEQSVLQMELTSARQDLAAAAETKARAKELDMQCISLTLSMETAQRDCAAAVSEAATLKHERAAMELEYKTRAEDQKSALEAERMDSLKALRVELEAIADKRVAEVQSEAETAYGDYESKIQQLEQELATTKAELDNLRSGCGLEKGEVLLLEDGEVLR